ncbi:transcription factor, putative [Ricinus communis]|uniref:Transcription factor, putative n=1 Tax=Ricinus communis TaxID=3988 RepID=B9SRH5_RICCO|nr:transcription factor, putative [Ricinus communis]
MEMEDHSHHNQYNIDLRQFITGRPTHFPPIPHPPELFSGHRNLQPPPPPPSQQHHYDMMMLMPGGEAEVGCSFGGDGGTGRWPRQETLTLLEIRSRLDSKFKEANQKGPLWDEVSRIMSEEHGYQRSGKKCREKFENLYKYYKKTKEGKAGRQDGKHYRFFRQLEALYGETSNPASVPDTQFVGNSLRFQSAANTSTQANHEAHHSQKLCDSLSFSNSSGFDTSSSEENDLSTATLVENDSMEKRRKRRDGKSWKAKIKEFIDSQMRKLIERQEAWLDKLTKTLEQKEQQRMLREEEWRRQESARIDREHKFWAKERAWIEARDAALMEALKKLTGRDQVDASSPEEQVGTQTIRKRSENLIENGSDQTIHNNVKGDHHSWPENEVTRLMQFRSSMESRFNQSGCIEEEEALWEEIAAEMACIGYERSALMCKEKWDSVNNYIRKTKESNNKKRKENSRGSCYNFQSNDQSVYNPGSGAYCEINEQGQEGSSPANSNAGNAVSDSCFRFLMSDGENLWENYGLKLSKGD